MSMSLPLPAADIVVLEDDDNLREIIRLSLERVGGLRVRTTACRDEALGAARGGEAAAILCDAQVSDLNVEDFMGRAAAPVVFLTTRVQRAEKARLERLRPAGVMAKPFDPMRLPTMVQDALLAAA